MSRPLALYELQKLGAPGGMGRAILLPVEYEFRNNLLSKLTIYIRHLQHIINGLSGLPLRRYGARHGVSIHHTCIELPLAADMLNKLRVPGAGDIAAIPPVENKFRNRILDKVAIDAALFHQDIHSICRGAPFTGDRDFAATAMVSALGLLPLAPDFFNIL